MIDYDSYLLTDKLYELLPNISVSIVGLGGAGSVLCQSLAHIGIRKFVLVDDDDVEMDNLKKLIGSTPQDTFKPKHYVMERLINSITGNDAKVEIIPSKFNRDSTDEIKNKLLETNFIFLCVDDPSDSEDINNFCVKNKKPFVYLGVGMEKEESNITSLVGNVILVRPGDPCLDCYNVNSKLPYLNNKIPYTYIHSIVSNLAVWEFLKFITGFGDLSHMVFYDALQQTVEKSMISSTLCRCNVCKDIGYS